MEQNKEWAENFWSTGYVICLGKDQYFQKIKNKRIVTAKIWKSSFLFKFKGSGNICPKTSLVCRYGSADLLSCLDTGICRK